MSIHSEAHAVIFVADYIGIDAAGKINAIGAGFALTGVTPEGQTPPQHVAVLIDVPSRYDGDEFALSLELREESSDSVVQVAGPTGQLEALRLQQVMQVNRPQISGAYLPTNLSCRVQATIGFPMGLQLQPGRTYGWHLQIDGQTRAGWVAKFHVVGPPPGPVFGGPSGPADIPGMGSPPAETT